MKEEYRKNAREFETEWLGEDISISDGDLTIHNRSSKGSNRIELKWHKPVMNLCQLKEFEKGRIHVIVHFNKELYNEKGRREFRSPFYLIYCPYKKYSYEPEKFVTIYGQLKTKGSHLIQEEKLRIEDLTEMRRIFRADIEFPCCKRFSEDFRVEESRAIPQ